MRRIIYIEGDTLGNLMFVTEAEPHVEPTGTKRRRALFKCHCGNEFESRIQHVKLGYVKSCGCTKGRSLKHGLCYHELYITWVNIKSRCYNENHYNYKYYGARNIILCDDWLENPKRFITHIMSLPNYGIRGLSLDRINNNGNYEPGNLRWTDAIVQSRNRNHTIYAS